MRPDWIDRWIPRAGILLLLAVVAVILICGGCTFPAVGNAGAQIIHGADKLEEHLDHIFSELQSIFAEFCALDEMIDELYNIPDAKARAVRGRQLTEKLDAIGERFAKLDFGKFQKYNDRIRTLGEELMRWAGGATMAISDDTFHIVLHQLVQDRIARERRRVLGAMVASKTLGIASGGLGGGLWGQLIGYIVGGVTAGGALYSRYKHKKRAAGQEIRAEEAEEAATDMADGIADAGAEDVKKLVKEAQRDRGYAPHQGTVDPFIP